MKNNRGTMDLSSTGVSRRPGRRRSRRRSYTLEEAIMPKTCGRFDRGRKSGSSARSILAGRVLFVLCGLLFIGTGIYNVLF